MGKDHPAVAPTACCTTSHRCHVSGKGILRFGGKSGRPDNFTRKFTKNFVLRTASSSVIVRDGPTSIGSGTLISENVVLTTAHTMDQAGTKHITVELFYECREGSAPPGESWQYYYPGMKDKQRYKTGRKKWCGCTKQNFPEQAKMTKILERGTAEGLDYALLAVRWNRDPRRSSPPREILFPKPDESLSLCLLLVQHPLGEPTQASAGRLIYPQVSSIHKETGGPYAYAVASFTAEHGSSGGGVFNEGGKIVGVFQGLRSSVGGTKHSGPHFLVLKKIDLLTRPHEGSRSRITHWFEDGKPYKNEDKKYF